MGRNRKGKYKRGIDTDLGDSSKSNYSSQNEVNGNDDDVRGNDDRECSSFEDEFVKINITDLRNIVKKEVSDAVDKVLNNTAKEITQL